MKKLYTIILLAFICASVGLHPFGANAQQQTFCVSINASTPGLIENDAFSIIQSTDGGYVIAGSAYDAVGTFTAEDAYIAKLNSAGVLQWGKAFGSVYQVRDWFTSVIQTTDGGYIAAGVTDNSSANDLCYVVKLDNAGNLQWQRTIGGGGVNSIIQTNDGGYVCVGPTIFKLNNSGALKWFNTLSQYQTGYDPNAIVQSNDKGFVIAGGYLPPSGGGGILVAKFDSAGTKKWSKGIYGQSGFIIDDGFSLVNSNDGGYIILGVAGSGNGDGYLCKVDSIGTLKWTKTISGLGNYSSTYRNCIIKTRGDGYVLSGYDILGSKRNAMIKLDSAFSIQWTKIIGSGNSLLMPVIQTKDGGYASAGSIFYGSNNVVYVVKLDSIGNGCCSYGPFATTINTVTSFEISTGNSTMGGSAISVSNLTANIGVLSNACLPLSVTKNLSCGSSPPCNDTVSINVSNGYWPYTYSWSNGQTTQAATGLCDGTTYTVTVTDASNATLTTTVIPKAITATMTITNATSCSSNNGQITASVSGGTAPYTYHWSNNIYVATDASLLPGTYTLTVTDANSCKKTFTATVTCPNGIANYDLQNEFSIYPNPNNGTFTITTQEKEYEIIISNLIGECIYRQIIKSTNHQIDLSEAKSGIYFLNIKTENGIANKKLIINK